MLLLCGFCGTDEGFNPIVVVDCCEKRDGMRDNVHVYGIFRGFPTRMVYLYYMSCLRYTILARNPRFVYEVHVQLTHTCMSVHT